MSTMLHIASFVVHHRPEAAARVDAALASLAGTELALREGGRSVVLCEDEDERGLLDRIEALTRVDGVLSVCLVHHHAESRHRLYEELPDDQPS